MEFHFQQISVSDVTRRGANVTVTGKSSETLFFAAAFSAAHAILAPLWSRAQEVMKSSLNPDRDERSLTCHVRQCAGESSRW